jgi:hypothetical protein
VRRDKTHVHKQDLQGPLSGHDQKEVKRCRIALSFKEERCSVVLKVTAVVETLLWSNCQPEKKVGENTRLKLEYVKKKPVSWDDDVVDI